MGQASVWFWCVEIKIGGIEKLVFVGVGVNLLRGGLWWLLAKETGQGDAKGWDGDQGREYGNVEWGEGRRRVFEDLLDLFNNFNF